jgi:predicted glycogen debranching enzyme
MSDLDLGDLNRRAHPRGRRRVPVLSWGREATRDLATAERREWLCANGIGGFASGTLAGTLTRRYHGLLVAALAPPLGRTLLVTKLEETAVYDGRGWPLSVNRWADAAVDTAGLEAIEAFRLDGTSPVWTWALGDAWLEKLVWMEPGANTTYTRYRLVRGRQPVALELRALVNHRDYHATTRQGGWSMAVQRVDGGVRVVAFGGARPVLLLAPGAEARPAHVWYERFRLAREEERGLDGLDDHLHAATFTARLEPGEALTVVASAEPAPSPDGQAAWRRRCLHEEELLARWQRGGTVTRSAPAWIQRLVLAADQFVVRRDAPGVKDGASIIAGYHWFGDWGRDTMIALPGLTLATGRPDLARQILAAWTAFVDRGLLPNRFPDAGEAPEYQSVDATLWYFEAVRAYEAATNDAATLARLFPVLEDVVGWLRRGTRYGIAEAAADGLIRAGESGVPLTWMDARAADRAVTPRTGKPIEINALWYNALVAMEALARRLGQPARPWQALAARVRDGFTRFWNENAGCCYDVLDGPDGADPSIRPNQILAVSLPASALSLDRQRAVVDACARQLLTSFGLRSLAAHDSRYRGHYAGNAVERDRRYHQGPAWGWLLGPFALAHFRVHGDRDTALSFLEPMAHHLEEDGLGSIAELFDGDPPHAPRGCIAQAWSVAETLRAWRTLAGRLGPGARRRRGPRAGTRVDR